MTIKRIKTAPDAIQTREEMEAHVGEITELFLKKRMLAAQLDADLQSIRDGYAPEIDLIDNLLKGKLALAQDWADSNPAAFGEAKSITMTHGTVGYKVAPPSLKLLGKAWNWEKVLKALISLRKRSYIRRTFDVNKQAILSDRKTLGEDGLAEFGVKVSQDKEFYIAPLVAEDESRLKEVA